MIDRYGRNITYARISVTDLCNLRCLYCMPDEGMPKKQHESMLRVEEIIDVAKALVSCGISKIRITGGEPLVRKGIMSIVRGIGQIDGLKTFSITTNGLLLQKYLKELYDAGITGVNISLDTLNPKKYEQLTKSNELDTVLRAIDSAQGMGFRNVKINSVLIKGFNDGEVRDLIALTRTLGVDVRFIELMPIGSQAEWAGGVYLPNDFVLSACPELIPAAVEDLSSPATYYTLPGASGKVGLISPLSCKFCGSCNRLRITADGKIRSCLHFDDEIDLKSVILDQEALKARIAEAVMMKPEAHLLGEHRHIKQNMHKIGG